VAQAKSLFTEVPAGSELMIRLDTPLPRTLRVGRGTAVLCIGACFHRRQRLRGLELLVDGVTHRPTAWRMPRLDLLRLRPRGPREDAEGGSYRSGFWTTLPIPARERPGWADLALRALLADGAEVVAPLGRIQIVEPFEPPAYGAGAEWADRGLIAVCMATYDPDMRLFRRQVQSLQEQTDRNWICLISDDCSPAERFEEIVATVARDERFLVSRSEQNLGPYRNFERALAMVPREAELVALADHDDSWYPDKLQVLRASLGGAQLVYSDQRLTDPEGRVLRDTFWKGRRNNYSDLASLVIANSVTGSAALFRREVAELARPFPDTPGWQFHDHWIALVAMAMGELAYVDRPLYDYVQHAQAVVGQVVDSADAGAGQRRSFAARWRAAYFYGYLAQEVKAQALLERCADSLTPAKRRGLERFVASGRNPSAFVWLAARPLRRLRGRNETLGIEAEFARGILWQHAARLLAGALARPRVDASCPPLEAHTLGLSRLARWRAGA
jgi:glycosyltransferase involved in cell wall biosynthesis